MLYELGGHFIHVFQSASCEHKGTADTFDKVASSILVVNK